MAIETLSEFETVKSALAAEMAKEPTARNVEFVRKAVTQLKAFENIDSPDVGDRADGTATEFINQGALAQEPLEVPQDRRIDTRDGPVDVPASQQLNNRAIVDSLTSRAKAIGDFVRRPFMDAAEQKELKNIRLDEQATDQVIQEELARRIGSDPDSLGVPRAIGDVVPDLALGGVAGLARSATGRIIGEGVAGAISGGSEVPLDQDPTIGSGAGALLGSGLGAALELPSAGRNLALREARRAAQSPETAIGKQLSEETGIQLSLAEQSLDARIEAIEAAVPITPGNPRSEVMGERQKALIREFDQIERTLNPEQLSTGTVISQTKDAFEGRVSELGKIASDKFKDTLRPAVEALGGVIDKRGRIIGGQRIVRVDNLLEEYRTQRQLGIDDGKLSPSEITELDNRIKFLEDANNQGGLDLGQAQREIKDLTDAAHGSGQVVRDRLTSGRRLEDRNLLSALQEDLEAVESAENAAFRNLPEAGVTALRQARNQYAADIDVIKQMQGDAMDRLLGKAGGPDAEQFAAGILRLPGKQFQELLEIADSATPGLANAIRGRVFAEIVDKHRIIGAGADDSALKLTTFISEFEKMPLSKFQAFLGSTDQVGARRIQQTFEVLKRIQAGPANQQSIPGALGRLEGIAINAASLNIPFISRFVTGELGPAFFEKALFTPEGRRALESMGDPQVTRAVFVQSATQLSRLLADSDAEIEQLKTEAKRAQVRERLDNPNFGRAL